MLPGEKLTCFIDRVVNPDTEYLKKCGETIDSVAEILRSKLFDCKVKQVIKGGSLGKGTGVRGRADADLLFPIEDIKSVDKLSPRLSTILETLKSTLGKVEYKVKNINKTDFALQFKIKIGSSWEDVDLIPIANIAEDPCNPTRSELNTIYQKMKCNQDLRNNYHRCLNPVQVEFVGKQPEKIKRTIRLLKYWIKTKKHTLKSYAVELLVIRAWEDLGKPHPGVTEDKIIKRVFAMLKDIGNIRVLWTEYYNPDNFNKPSPPYIMDPADPYHNMIGKSAVAYWGGCNQAVLEAAGTDRDLVRLQSDAKRAFECFE